MDQNISLKKKIFISIIYGLSGLILMFINKIVLTTYSFPYFSVMAFYQAFSITVVLYILKTFNFVTLPKLSVKLLRQLFPISILYLFNLLTGLGATKYISVPIFVALRRFTIPITLILQYYLLKMKVSKKIIFSIFILVLGSLIACLKDFEFNLLGYILCLANDFGDSFEQIFTKRQLNKRKRIRQISLVKKLPEKDFMNEMNSVISNENISQKDNFNVKEKLIDGLNKDFNNKSFKNLNKKETKIINKDLKIGKVAIIYYCALLNIIPLFIIVLITGDLQNSFHFEGFKDKIFLFFFVSCSLFSIFFLFTWITCNDFNSPLLTQIVSALRSILTTYLGIYIGGDYTFSFLNFFGLNLSMLGAFYYTYVNFTEEHLRETNKKENSSPEEKQVLIA